MKTKKSTTTKKRVAPKKGTAKKAAKATAPHVPASARNTKKDTIMALIGREGGATLKEVMAATEWIEKSVRGFIATANKVTPIKSERDSAGERRYTLVQA